MNDPSTLTEGTVRGLAGSRSYDRGESYYERGAVGSVVRRGDRLRADVAGSQASTYSVTIEFDDTGVASTDCSCPYDHGGICKHRVAVLLTAVRDPDRIVHERPISERLAAADRETLEDLLVELVDSRPELAGWIETRLQTRAVAEEATTNSTVSVDLSSIRAQAEDALPKPPVTSGTMSGRICSGPFARTTVGDPLALSRSFWPRNCTARPSNAPRHPAGRT